MRQTHDLTRIITSDPVDAVAGRVISRGTHWKPKKVIKGIHSELPLQTRPANNLEKSCGTFEDMTGRKFGRLEVLGIFVPEIPPEPKKNKKQSWVVRCQCGRYELRTARSIRNADENAKCEICHHLTRVQREEITASSWQLLKLWLDCFDDGGLTMADRIKSWYENNLIQPTREALANRAKRAAERPGG